MKKECSHSTAPLAEKTGFLASMETNIAYVRQIMNLLIELSVNAHLNGIFQFYPAV